MGTPTARSSSARAACACRPAQRGAPRAPSRGRRQELHLGLVLAHRQDAQALPVLDRFHHLLPRQLLVRGHADHMHHLDPALAIDLSPGQVGDDVVDQLQRVSVLLHDRALNALLRRLHQPHGLIKVLPLDPLRAACPRVSLREPEDGEQRARRGVGLPAIDVATFLLIPHHDVGVHDVPLQAVLDHRLVALGLADVGAHELSIEGLEAQVHHIGDRRCLASLRARGIEVGVHLGNVQGQVLVLVAVHRVQE
mmetsp:Transcript_114067/g.158171  ORF Transcript_114067/g.158171 Transcript_114067/m.158171 type:complete len:252 (+) Transcript_114067:368-1123(+)